MAEDRIPYDEMGLFHQNAEEFGLPWTGPPAVRRTSVALPDGRQLSALVWGTTPPELVFLHGGGQNAHTWDTVALALGRPLVAIDLPGHGHSSGPGPEQLHGSRPRGAAVDVAVAVRELAPNARGVVGMSFGGLTTVALTAHAPDLVRRVYLVDVLPGLTGERSKHITEFLAGPVTFPSFDEILERTMKFNPTRTESSMRRGILHNAVQLDDGSWAWRHSLWRLDQPDAATAGQPAGSGSSAVAEASADAPAAGGGSHPGGPTRYDDLVDDLARIRVPLLLARGLRPDSVLREDDEERLRQLLPDATIEQFPEAGHSIQGDMPVELAASIARFIP